MISLRTSHSPLLVLKGEKLTLIKDGKSKTIKSPIHIPNNNVLVLKLEYLRKYNPTGSLYDRVYARLIKQFEHNGLIVPGKTPLVECSVGNAGAAFARACMDAGYKDYRVIIPEDIYSPRINLIESLGAQVIKSPKEIGPWGYVNKIEQLAFKRVKDGKRQESCLIPISKIRRIPSYPYANLVHEVIYDLSLLEHKVPDCFIFGVGAGNTISYVGQALKNANPKAHVVCAEFRERAFSSLLLKGRKVQEGGAWIDPEYLAGTIHGVPHEKLNLNLNIIDEVRSYPHDIRNSALQSLNNSLDLQAGRTSAMAWAAMWDFANEVKGKVIFSIIFDGLDKYFYDPPSYDISVDKTQGIKILNKIDVTDSHDGSKGLFPCLKVA
jgi:cysteine synthase